MSLLQSVLLKPSYWFNLQPEMMNNRVVQVFLTFFIFLFLLAMVVRMVARKHKVKDRYILKGFRQLSNGFFTMSVIGLFLVFFSYEAIPFFSARFWYLLWVIAMIIWLFFVWRYMFKTAAQKRLRSQEQKNQEKYLPKSKSKQ
ncbi:hypothetical protein CO172_02630 [Candidatus Uhrbacteria bacterium CG_4_9_14_3_um_filter_36_7]|uniref:Uncharacterized protein n=1 Tax=Candidatus Uhrbacteria bacterium CG_4_9_14_3_um_filter_36_7 TaxID=1975033 RepID=A0A2M7XH68_9BACT|nr:MAG: hypothetical protein CO172_02630 [Candidatus Uhrbacteria bacterium CG_4_9_14_3_um_filter_36_7]